jgi:hypothetical protein
MRKRLIRACSTLAFAAATGSVATVALVFSVTAGHELAVQKAPDEHAASASAGAMVTAASTPRQQAEEAPQSPGPQQQMFANPSAANSTSDQLQSGAADRQPPASDQDFDHGAPTAEASMDAVNRYLWSVYERMPLKRDSSGDFTWKDFAAAQRLGMSLGDYVIRGMDPDFRELLYRAGLAMDAAGIHWTILSAFRDDFRQSLASGYKARTDNSLHGGSAATGGYGHGCAIDVVDADGEPDVVFRWLDANSAQVGLQRPLPGIDPAHVQPRGAWHEQAALERNERLKNAPPGQQPAGSSEPAVPSEADLMCTGLRHRHGASEQARAPLEHRSFASAARTHPRTKTVGPKGKWVSVIHEKVHAGVQVRATGGAKPPSHGKSAAREARHEQRAIPRSAGAT